MNTEFFAYQSNKPSNYHNKKNEHDDKTFRDYFTL